jgi:50S ribosomal subunit-associated GTPase HflX
MREGKAGDKMQRTKQTLLILIICVLAAVALAAGRAETSAGQDVMSLDRRINTLEQRLYSIESNINQLRQQVSFAERQSATQGTRDPGVEQLRLEIDLLRRRIVEIECSVVKLDERTLSPTQRGPRRADKQPADPCRLSPETPVQLSFRRP